MSSEIISKAISKINYGLGGGTFFDDWVPINNKK